MAASAGAYTGYSVVFVTTVARGISHLANPSGIMLVLYRDAFMASTCLLSFSLANTILSSLSSPQFYLPWMLSFGFSFVVPCRIILNLRATTMERDTWDVSTGRTAVEAARDRQRMRGRGSATRPSDGVEEGWDV